MIDKLTDKMTLGDLINYKEHLEKLIEYNVLIPKQRKFDIDYNLYGSHRRGVLIPKQWRVDIDGEELKLSIQKTDAAVDLIIKMETVCRLIKEKAERKKLVGMEQTIFDCIVAGSGTHNLKDIAHFTTYTMYDVERVVSDLERMCLIRKVERDPETKFVYESCI